MAQAEIVFGELGTSGGTPTFTVVGHEILAKSSGTATFTISLSKKYIVSLTTCTTLTNSMVTAKDGVTSMVYIDKGEMSYINNESSTQTSEPHFCYLTPSLSGTTLTITNSYAQYGEANVVEVG